MVIENRIYHWYVEYQSIKQSNNTLGEVRPFFVLSEQNKAILFLPIEGLEHLKHKSPYIQEMALKVLNYRKAKLSKPSYIDVGHGIITMAVADFENVVEEKHNIGLGKLTESQLDQLYDLIAKL